MTVSTYPAVTRLKFVATHYCSLCHTPLMRVGYRWFDMLYQPHDRSHPQTRIEHHLDKFPDQKGKS